MSDEWVVEFNMGKRVDERVPRSPFTYLEEAIKRKTPQSFFITASCLVDDSTYTAHPIVALVQEKVRHTPSERKLFLDNIITMLELMEAQRNVDAH